LLVSCDECGSTAPVACTLAASDVPARLEAWQAALATVTTRAWIDNGVRLVFESGASLPALAELVVAEQECCTFFRFAITVDTRGVALEVTAPAEAIDLVHALVGTPT